MTQRIEGTARANAASTVAVSATSSASNAPPPRRTPIASGPRARADRRDRREHPDRERVDADLAAEPAPVARRHAADRPGNAASAIDAPISATGTLWKLRANDTAGRCRREGGRDAR